jgi:hypothetical protein
MVARIGLVPEAGRDRSLVGAMLKALRSRRVGIDRFFFDWRGGRAPDDAVYDDPTFDALRRELEGRLRPPTHEFWADEAPCSMSIDEVEEIWEAIAKDDDWAPFERKIAAIRRFGDAITTDAP